MTVQPPKDTGAPFIVHARVVLAILAAAAVIGAAGVVFGW